MIASYNLPLLSDAKKLGDRYEALNCGNEFMTFA